jgi:hypothetical protein
MDGASMNSGALRQTVRDAAKTQEQSDVTSIHLIEIQLEIFASMHDCVGEMKYYEVQMLVVTWTVLGKG